MVNTVTIDGWPIPTQDGHITFHKPSHGGRLLWVGVGTANSEGKDRGRVLCYKPGSGRAEWKSPELDDWPCSADVDRGGRVLVTTDNGRVTCYAKDGSVVWRSGNDVWAKSAWFAIGADMVQIQCARAGLLTMSMAGWKAPDARRKGAKI